MSFAPADHFLDAFKRAPVSEEPFPYLDVDEALPRDYYDELLMSLPDLDAYAPIGETGRTRGGYEERYVCKVRSLEGSSPFWTELSGWLHGSALATAVIEKFAGAYLERFGRDVKVEYEIDVRLVRDFTNYAIGPHTDAPQKLASLLFYLPADDGLSQLGTSLYIPKDRAFRCAGGPHHPFEPFRLVATARYTPNRLLAFPKLDRSFHGVERIAEKGVERDLLLYNLYVVRLLRLAPERGAPPTFFPAPARQSD
jgi:hypothetical protein